MKSTLYFKLIFAYISIFLVCSSVSAQNLNSLILHYTFDNSSLDDNISNNDIVSFGAIPCEDRFGNLNFAYEFNNNYLLTPNPISLGPLTQASVSVWIKPELSELGSSISCIANPGYWGIYLNKFSTNGKILGMMDGSSNNNSSSNESSILPQNEWVLVTLVNDGTISKLYINGILQSSYNEVFSFTDNVYALYLGARGYSTPNPTDFFNGKIDDFRIYGKALTDLDIDSLYNIENPTASFHKLTSEANLFQIYPNPVKERIFVNLPSELETSEIIITDISGKNCEVIFSSTTNTLDVSHLNAGTYFLTFIMENRSQTLKFEKQ